MGKKFGDEVRPLKYPPLQKYVIKEKTLHHRHFLQYDNARKQIHEYCKESGCIYKKQESKHREGRTCNRLRTTEIKSDFSEKQEPKPRNKSRGKENTNPNKPNKFQSKYPQNLVEVQESPKANQSLKYILKPILYSRIDEYFVENEKEEAVKRTHRNQQTRTKIVNNFEQLYENHCRLIEAQNMFIHEHMQLVKARQMLQANSEKARWMANHAEVFSRRQQKIENNRSHVLKQHNPSHAFQQAKGPAPIFQQYVSTL